MDTWFSWIWCNEPHALIHIQYGIQQPNECYGIKLNIFNCHCACVGLMVFMNETFHYNLDWFIQFNYTIIL